MKKYGQVAHVLVSIDDSNDFIGMIAKHVDELQREGFQIELQYQHTVNSLSVLILGYKEDGVM